MAGLLVLGVHNLTDFSVELLGVILPAAMVLGAIRGRRGDRFTLRKVEISPRIAVYGLSILVLGLGVSFASSARAGLERDTRAVQGMVAQKTVPEEALPLLREAMSRHPADYFLPYLGGVWAAATPDQNPMRWFNRSLALNPRYGWTHYQIGHLLLARGKVSQSVVEFRLAIGGEPQLAPRIVAELVRVTPVFETLRLLATEPERQMWIWSMVANALAGPFEQEAAKADAALLDLDPFHADALVRSGFRAVATGEAERAHDLARRLAGAHPALSARIASRAYILKGDVSLASKTLEDAITRHPDERWTLLGELAEQMEAAHDTKGARNALERLSTSARSPSELCDSRRLQAQFEIRQGNRGEALSIFRKAPTVCQGAIVEETANLAEEAGDLKLALESVRRLVREPDGARFAARLANLESKVPAR